MAEIVDYVQTVSVVAAFAFAVYLFTRRHPVARALAWLFLIHVIVGVGNRLRGFGAPESLVNVTRLGYPAALPVAVYLGAVFRGDSPISSRWSRVTPTSVPALQEGQA